MSKKTVYLIVFGVLLAIVLPFAWQNIANIFQKSENRYKTGSLKVVATIYPVYDLAKNIGGRNAEVSVLVSPAMDIHAYEPSSEDIRLLENADLIVYAGKGADPWAPEVIASLQNKTAIVISAGQGAGVVPTIPGLNEDSHYWLFPNNISYAISSILSGFIQKDPDNKEYYSKNAKLLADEYLQISNRYEILKNCPEKNIKYSGHNAYSWLATAYKLKFIKSTGVLGLSDAESPSKDDRNANIGLGELLNRNLIYFKDQLKCK
jgi:zinc transport system substrate-binding protein